MIYQDDASRDPCKYPKLSPHRSGVSSNQEWEMEELQHIVLVSSFFSDSISWILIRQREKFHCGHTCKAHSPYDLNVGSRMLHRCFIDANSISCEYFKTLLHTQDRVNTVSITIQRAVTKRTKQNPPSFLCCWWGPTSFEYASTVVFLFTFRCTSLSRSCDGDSFYDKERNKNNEKTGKEK